MKNKLETACAIAILLASLIPRANTAISMRQTNERALVCGQRDLLAHFVFTLVFAMTDPFAFKYHKYSLNQKEKLAKLCLKYKLEADSSKEKHWDPKRKKFVAHQQSFKSRAVWEFFSTLKKAKSDSTEFKRALVLQTDALKSIPVPKQSRS